MSASSETGLRLWLLAWLGLPCSGSPTAPSGTPPTSGWPVSWPPTSSPRPPCLVLMAAYLWALERRWPIRTSRDAFTIGGSWALLTILFEFGFGHYVVGDSWATLHAYNLAEGGSGRPCPSGPRSGRRSSGGAMAAADQPAYPAGP